MCPLQNFNKGHSPHSMAHGHHGKGHGKGGMKHFQIKLAGEWRDYSYEEDRCLIRAYSTGQDKVCFPQRGKHYEYDFGRMEQRNTDTGKTRAIRPPPGMRRPAKAMVPKGPTMVVTIPDRVPMPKAIELPHPRAPRQMIAVKVPKGARPGHEMLIPIPPVMAEAVDASELPKKSGGMGASTKVAAGVAGVTAVGGAFVVGAIVADVLDEDAGIADFAEDAGDAIFDAAEDATEWLAEAGDDAGDFIMDLF